MEVQPHTINRRRLLAALGAGVLIATVGYTLHKSAGLDDDRTLIHEDQTSSEGDYESYPFHENIITTVFWVGEEGNASTNDNIHNISSVWVEDWVGAFGGVDDPESRCEVYKPCGFEPKENPFYFALPFSEYNENGLKPESELKVIPWYEGDIEPGDSILKNRWIEIEYDGKKGYAQWEDAGPFGEDDAEYVFGSSDPKEARAGLDVSPAVATYLGFDGRAVTSWRFVEESEVPDGPWKEIITTSGPDWD